MSLYHEYCEKLKSICVKRGVSLRTLGFINKIYPLFAVTLSPSRKPRAIVCFSAGIHGDEIAGPLAVLQFLKTCKISTASSIKIIIFPIANPSGFDRGKRRNWRSRDLNRHFFDTPLRGENKFLYNYIKNKRVAFFHAIHEDPDENKFYLYAYEKRDEPIYRALIPVARKYFSIKHTKTIYNDPAKNGIVFNKHDRSFEDRMFHDGVTYALCTETPGKKLLSKRVALNVQLMHKVINFVASSQLDK